MIKRFCFCTFLFISVSTSVVPEEKCNLEDSSCMIPAFQKMLPIFTAGIPEYGIEVMDVMELDNVQFELAGLKFSLKDGRVKGLKNSIIDDVKWSLKNKTFNVDYHVDASIKGLYKASGKVLILPISGDGEMKLKLKNVAISLAVFYEMEKKDGKDYVVPKSYTYKYEVKDNANFDLTNLFNGNKELSDHMLTFLNENWKDITTEFGGPLLDAAAKKLFKGVSAFLAKFPIADIANV